MRATMIVSGDAIGAILAIVLLTVFTDPGPVANAAITAISAIVGAAVGVAKACLRCSQRSAPRATGLAERKRTRVRSHRPR